MIPYRLAVAAFAVVGAVPSVSAAFEVSDDYIPRPELRSGHYICRTVLDLYNATYSFDLTADGKYQVRTFLGKGMAQVHPDGGLVFLSGFFAPDEETAGFEAMNTTRVEDGTPVIILRSAAGDEDYDHYCPWIE